MDIPADAVYLNVGYRSPYKMYRFSDGRIHDLVAFASINRKGSALQKIGRSGIGPHVRLHVNRGIKKIGCKFCFPQESIKK
jgi:hypothetical protein